MIVTLSGAGIAIDGTIEGATDGALLFVGPDGTLAQTVIQGLVKSTLSGPVEAIVDVDYLDNASPISESQVTGLIPDLESKLEPDPFGFGDALTSQDVLEIVNTKLARERIKTPRTRKFLPPMATGLLGWFEANNTGVNTDGAKIAQWNDLSGNNWHMLQPNPALQPTLSLTGGNNGTPTVVFSGSNWMASALFSLFPQPITVYMVLRCDGVGNANIFDGHDGSGTNSIFYTAGEMRLYAGGSAFAPVYPQTAPFVTHNLFRFEFNGATSRGYRFGNPGPATDTSVAGSGGLNGFTLGAYQAGAGGSFSSGGAIALLAVYHALHSPRESLAVENYIRSVCYTEINPALYCDGDSLTVGYELDDPATQSYPAQLQSILGGPALWDMHNVAVSGRSLATLLTTAHDAVDPLVRNGRPRQVCIVYPGVNDLLGIATAPDTPAGLHANLQSYCLARRAIGIKTIVVSIPPSTYPGTVPTYESDRLTYNSLMRAHYTDYADGFGDFGADPYYGNVANSVAVTIDGLHYKAPAYAALARQYLLPAINSFR